MLSLAALPYPAATTASLVSLFALVVTCGLSMAAPLDHDEHQFLASAYLTANEDLLPYHNYPFHHLPNLLFAYAGFSYFTSHLLLVARLSNAVVAAALATLVFVLGYRLLARYEHAYRLTAAASLALLLLTSPLYHAAATRVWNHAMPTLLCATAFLLHCWAIRRDFTGKALFLSGLCLGAAVGSRLSFILAVAPFCGAILLLGEIDSLSRRCRALLVFGIGLIVANLPTIALFLVAPRQLIYGNLDYHYLNTLYRLQQGYSQAMTPGSKMGYLASRVLAQPPHFCIVALGIFTLFLSSRRTHLRAICRQRFEAPFLASLVLFLLAGALAPTPSWYQYFFTPVFFLLLLLVYALAAIQHKHMQRTAVWLTGSAAVLCAVHALPIFATGRVLASLRTGNP